MKEILIYRDIALKIALLWEVIFRAPFLYPFLNFIG